MSDFSTEDMLRRVPYFAGVPEARLETLARAAVPRRFAPGEPLFREGETAAGLWFVESGRVKIYRLAARGQEYILRFVGPGEPFNDLAVLDGAPNAASAAAVTPVRAWLIPTAEFTAALRADNDLALAVLRGLAGRVRQLVARAEDLALRSVTARLARFLLEQVEDPTLAHPALTRALIASHLATTPESISRSLRALEEAGAIRFDRQHIVIVDAQMLRELAGL